MAKRKRSGKPKALEEPDSGTVPSLEEHIQEIHGTADTPQSGLPPLEWLKSQYNTKSAAIRFLVNQGHATKVIAKHLGVRYQMVRNVKTNPLKRGPNESWLPKQDLPKPE
jgi:hypothetical protein